MNYPFVLIGSLVLLALPLCAQQLVARAPLPKHELVAPVNPSATEPSVRLIVKFQDALRVRAGSRAGIFSLAGSDLVQVSALATKLGFGFERVLGAGPQSIADLERRAEHLSGRAQPDLEGMLLVRAEHALALDLVGIGNALQALDAVEFAALEPLYAPPPGDYAPTTPDLVPAQNWRGPDPGISVDYAWSTGAKGAGVKLCDAEYGWGADHEDLVDKPIHPQPGKTIDPGVYSLGYDQHGSAALGLSVAVPNAYGCSGAAPDVDPYTFPEWTLQDGFNPLGAVLGAIAGAGAGDVVLLEMQAFGPTGQYSPVEVNALYWTAIRTGVDAGIVVVEAAGNGGQDLDGAPYANWLALGDSGATLVGAGSATTAHVTLGFSNYGSRVDVQGWGESVLTLGYGTYLQVGNDIKQSYSHFSGTSSGSAMVAAACCILQSAALQISGQPMLPLALRELLELTGHPQSAGGHIGPSPDLEAALVAMNHLLTKITSVSAAKASAPGQVQVAGTHLAGVSSAKLNGTSASITSQSDTALTLAAQPDLPGTGELVLSNALGGASASVTLWPSLVANSSGLGGSLSAILENGAAGLFVLALATQVLPAPIPLGADVYHGLLLDLVSPWAILTQGFLPASGAQGLSFPIGNDPALVGATIHLQGWAQSGGGPGPGSSFTNAVAIVLQ